MILVDVNILIYAFDETASAHEQAYAWIDETRHRREIALSDVISSGFLRLVTNPRVFGSRTARLAVAVEFLDALAARHLRGGAAVLDEVRRLALADSAIRGNLVPDAWIAATALAHGAMVATADAGFARYSRLRLINPLLDG